MKTKLFLILSVLSILTMLVSVAAAPAKKGDITGLTLTGVKYEPGKGVVLKFTIEGDATQSRYSGVAKISGTEFPITCQTNDSNELVCVVSGGVSQFEGKTIYGSVYGFAFSATVPVKRAACTGYSFQTQEGYSYIWDNADIGQGLVFEYYGEHVVGGVGCVTGEWEPNLFDGSNYWYETYVGP